MKVLIEPYNVEWENIFHSIKNEIKNKIDFLNLKIEHIGSTSIKDLSAKPIIDIMAGVQTLKQLDKTIEPLIQSDYIYFEKFNSQMPYRRFFVKLKSTPKNLLIPTTYFENDLIPNELNDHKLAHIHVFEYNSPDWNRHIAFREYLKNHDNIKKEYQKIKTNLSLLNWENGSEYNNAKNDFIRKIEQKAINWYEKLQ